MTDNPLYREGRKWARLTSGTNILRATGNTAWLHSIIPGDPAPGTVTIYNNGAASGDVFALITLTDTAALRNPFLFDVRLDSGLTIVLSAPMNLTVVYE